jgi:hypothetical protein
MTKISRPFQIALVAVALLAAVYFVALRKHSSSRESSAPAPVASTATPSTASSASTASAAGTSASSSSAASPSAGGPSGGTSTYKGSAPGVDGLTRAIQKARGAVSESEQHAKALQQKATAASGTAEKLGSSATGTAGVAAAATGGTAAAKHSAAATHAASSAAAAVQAKSKTPASKAGASKTASGVPVMQARVERELKRGDIAALLFWNPSGTVDKTVRRELQATARKLHGKLAISVARSSEVGSFGTFTRTVQVYGTPTILLINPAGKTASVTGLTDVFSLEQAVREIKHSK